jgi:hypothetical protein
MEPPKFITALTRACRLSSWARSIHSTPYPTSWRPILILSSHLRLCLPSGLSSSGFLTKTLYAPLLSPHACYMPRPSHYSGFDHRNIIRWGVQIVKLRVMPSPPYLIVIPTILRTIHKPYTVIPRLTKIIRSGVTFVSRNVISRRFL